MRWSGKQGTAMRVRFIGTEQKAREVYAKLHYAMRQGAVELLDGDGRTVLLDWAPRLRTRW
jgi:hypothetical protein